MREIKFRVRDIKSSCYIYWDEIKKSNSIFIWINANNRGDKNIALEQYTGLKDKNGVEIYEGDTREGSYYSGDIEHYGRQIMTWDNKSACFYWEGSYLPSFINIEVIGNIYDNPKLLEQ